MEATTTVNVRYMVDDVDVAVAWYTKHLGFKVPLQCRTCLCGRGTRFAKALAQRTEKLCRTSNARWGAPRSWRLEPHSPHRGGYFAEVVRLRAAGVEFRNDIVTGPGGSQILLKDPSGNFVELFQPASR
jgi:catechol 2,3-dioxygenase-like lactoylglutathione lyase family enzyme